MNTITRHRPHRWLTLALAALATACADQSPLGPEPLAPAAHVAARGADLGSCDSLAVPAGSRLAFHVYAEGVQIYRWTGASWGFVGPSATLSSDAEGQSTVGTHYAGPTGPGWESNAGGTVVGAVLKRCPGDAGAIPWLLLGATPDGGPGIFSRVAFIQRVNTAGGVAPAAAGAAVGEEAHVPYTTEYLFYRAP
jgi:hypothetical protein